MAIDVDTAMSAGRPDVIQVAMAADRGFVLPLAVALTSLALAHEPGELAVTVLHDGLAEHDLEQIERSVAGRFEVCWRQVATDELDGVHYYEELSRATLFRLQLPKLVAPSLERVIFLDADTVVCESLRPLWEMDLDGYELAAVRDAGAPFAAGPYGTDWRRLGLEPGAPYFNAGLLVIPLDAWRSAAVSRRILEVLRECSPPWGDQCGLNAVLHGRWKELPRRWNVQTSDAEERSVAWGLWPDEVRQALIDPAMIHYTERDKPWDPGTRHPLAAHWYEALEQSAWRGWRPASRPLHRRVTSRTARALRVLTAPPSSPPILR